MKNPYTRESKKKSKKLIGNASKQKAISKINK